MPYHLLTRDGVPKDAILDLAATLSKMSASPTNPVPVRSVTRVQEHLVHSCETAIDAAVPMRTPMGTPSPPRDAAKQVASGPTCLNHGGN